MFVSMSFCKTSRPLSYILLYNLLFPLNQYPAYLSISVHRSASSFVMAIKAVDVPNIFWPLIFLLMIFYVIFKFLLLQRSWWWTILYNHLRAHVAITFPFDRFPQMRVGQKVCTFQLWWPLSTCPSRTWLPHWGYSQRMQDHFNNYLKQT